MVIEHHTSKYCRSDAMAFVRNIPKTFTGFGSIPTTPALPPKDDVCRYIAPSQPTSVSGGPVTRQDTYSSAQQILTNSGISGAKGAVTSSVTALMGAAADMAIKDGVYGYTRAFVKESKHSMDGLMMR